MSTESRSHPPTGIIRQQGVNASERYLDSLCSRTFLSLWSYPAIFRDQGQPSGTGVGKEICDLFVVFGNDIILWSDKACRVPSTGDAFQDWSRWYRRAILASAKQLWGAERWIKQFPNRIFLDRECQIPFPLVLPDESVARFHRILVAHDADAADRSPTSTITTLGLRPAIVGDLHLARPAEGGIPFSIGNIDSRRGFIHVFGDDSLESVMSELDTVSDFVSYLVDKEELIIRDQLEFAASERDLLADYRFPEVGKEVNRFSAPPPTQRLVIPTGRWKAFEADSYRATREAANRFSYFWDEMIERTSQHVMAGTQYYASEAGAIAGSKVLSFMASESRFRRRHLAESWLALVASADPIPNYRAIRAVVPGNGLGCHYVYLLLSEELDGIKTQEEYREARRNLLAAACEVYAAKNRSATDVVGIASELGQQNEFSEDIIYLNTKEISERDHAAAIQRYAPLGLFTNVTGHVATQYEYPAPGSLPANLTFSPAPPLNSAVKGRDRNQPCRCGSGRKTKKCCGRFVS